MPDQCADGCPPYLIKDGSCDEACNVEACLFDGNQLTLLPTADPHHVSGDCDYGHDECYTKPDGTDYHGTVDETEDGDACLVWDHKSNIKWARDLGGHNYCRNPEVLNSEEPRVMEPRGERPWCFKADEFAGNDDKRWGYCNVQEASKAKDAHGEPCPGVYRAKANFAAEAVSNALDQLQEKGLDEVSNEAAAAPLITIVLSITSVLLIGSLVFTRRMMQVWHAPAPVGVGVRVWHTPIDVLESCAPRCVAAAQEHVRAAPAADASLARGAERHEYRGHYLEGGGGGRRRGWGGRPVAHAQGRRDRTRAGLVQAWTVA